MTNQWHMNYSQLVAIIDSGSIKTNFKSELAAKATKDSPYYNMSQATVEAIEGMVRQGIHPKEVAKVVIDAIDDPKRKFRYIVGKDAEEIIEASKKLPEQGLFQTISQNILKRGRE